MIPRLVSDPTEGPAILSLLHAAFASMQGRINPPSSLHSLTVQGLFAAGEVWVLGASPVACVILSPRERCLYLGKLAVAPGQTGKGYARALIDHAAHRARALGLPLLELQTRVELVENHVIFRAMGFVETARSAHPGFAQATTITFQRPV
jgi:GNAT superfamily N-acetyltransferase